MDRFSRKSYMKKLLLIVLVLVVVVSAITIMFTPLILQSVLKSHLKEIGFYPVELSLNKLSFTQAEFDNVILQKKLVNHNQVTIKIPNIKVRYSIGSLLRGNLDSAVIEKLKVRVVLGTKTIGGAESLLPNVHSLPVNWLQINSVMLEVYNLAATKPWLVVQGRIKSRGSVNSKKVKIVLEFVTNKVDFAINQSNFGSFSLTGGKAKLVGTITWSGFNKKLIPNINLAAEQLTGSFNTLKFTGLNGNLEINSFTPLQTKLKQRLHIATIKYNLVVTDVAAIFGLQFTKQNKFGIFIDAIKAKIAGGSIYAKDIVLKNDDKKHAFELFVKNIDATKLLAMANQKRLYAKGLLNGSLVMEYGATGFSVKSGSLNSSNGVVRYLVDKTSSEFKAMDPAVQQVLEILEDFHYKKLVLSMGENAVNDQAIVTIRAFGANPDFYANSPVDFNFKITGPLRRMLYSFFVGEDAKQYLLQLSK